MTAAGMDRSGLATPSTSASPTASFPFFPLSSRPYRYPEDSSVIKKTVEHTRKGRKNSRFNAARLR